MRTSKERKEIEYFNEHVYNEANKILPEDTESTITGKIMAENLIVNIILDRPFTLKFVILLTLPLSVLCFFKN